MGVKKTDTKAAVKKPAAKKPARASTMPKMGVEKETIKLIVFDLWIKAYSYRAIAQALEKAGYSVSIVTISAYVRGFLKDFKEERTAAIDDMKRAELIKLDKLEQTYWAAWEQSIGIVTSRSFGGWENDVDVSDMKAGIKTIALDEETNTVVKGNTAKANANRKNKKYVNYSENMNLGDVRYLMGVERCIDKRCKMLGLDAPIVIEDKTKNRVTRNINISVYSKPNE